MSSAWVSLVTCLLAVVASIFGGLVALIVLIIIVAST